jgi:hypothetical protein
MLNNDMVEQLSSPDKLRDNTKVRVFVEATLETEDETMGKLTNRDNIVPGY